MNRLQKRWVSMAMAALAAAGGLAAQAPDESIWKQDVSDALSAAKAQNYPVSEQAFLKALHEAEKFGANDVKVGSTLNSLGLVYRAEKKYSEAEKAYRRALGIMQAAYGDSLDVANLNFNIANVMFDQGRHSDALPNLHTTLRIYQKLLGDDSMKTAAALCMEGEAYRQMKRYADAEADLRQCAGIREKDAGIESNDVADAQYSLALILMGEGKYSAAEPRLKLVEEIREKTLGITSPLLAQTMEEHATALKELGRQKEADKLIGIATAIRHAQPRAK